MIIRRQPGSIRLPLSARRKCRPSDFEPKRPNVTREQQNLRSCKQNTPDASVPKLTPYCFFGVTSIKGIAPPVTFGILPFHF